MTLASEGLPEGLRGEFDVIWNRLTREKAAGGEDAIQATARKMSSEDASELAHRILSIYAMLRVGSASRTGRPGRKPAA